MKSYFVLFAALLSFGASAGSHIEYGTQTKEIQLCGPMQDDGITHQDDFAMAVPKYLVTTTTIRTPIYTCENTGGDGKGDWKGFYDRSGNKAGQLANAIKGVGERVAPHLVEVFLRDKPRSWQAFSDRIREGAKIAERDGGIAENAWVPLVLYKFKQENMENLGYFDRTQCRVTGYDERTYTDREQIDVVSNLVRVDVSGGTLLPSECETLKVLYKGNSIETSSDGVRNKYRATVDFSSQRSHVSFIGTRQAIRPAQLVDGSTSLAKISGNVVNITLSHPDTVKNSALNAYRDACKAEVTVDIQGKKRGFWGPKRETIATKKFALEMGATSTDVSISGISLEAEAKLAVQVTTNYLPGCPFFNTDSSQKADLRTADLR